jgi:hypothetical protein
MEKLDWVIVEDEKRIRLNFLDKRLSSVDIFISGRGMYSPANITSFNQFSFFLLILFLYKPSQQKLFGAAFHN